MSFILDALKKSENERQRTIGPSLADAPAHIAQGERPWWAVAVGALLVVNLGVLLFVLMRDDRVPAAVPEMAAPVAAAPVTTQSASPAQPRPNVDASVRSLAEEAGATPESYYDGVPPDYSGYLDPNRPDLAAAANVPEGPPLVRSIDPPSVAPLPARPANDVVRNNSGEVLPSASSLMASGTSLPDLRLDIHVYSNKPADRFVFINMHKYTEGQVLTEGPTVERITPEGAVLNQQGLRFVLPRQ